MAKGLIQPAMRVRKDIMLVLASMVALTGGVVVYGSFAGKHVNTIEPGVVSAEQVRAGLAAPSWWRSGTSKYHFATKAGLLYCFWGQHAAGAGVSAQIKMADNTQTVSASFDNASTIGTDESLVCFAAPTSTGIDVSVALTGAGQINSLHVVRPQ